MYLEYDCGVSGGDPMDPKKTGALIAKRRGELNLTQTELAEKLGVTNKAISRWETGRGYPDIEMLPELAKVLDISVQELLDGAIGQPEHEDRSLQYVCDYAGWQRRKLKYEKVLIIALVLLWALSWLIPHAGYFYYSVIGSEDCVISSDYMSIMLFGEEYVSLPLNGYECVDGAAIVDEAQVEGVGFIGKLFFGERVYEVKNAPNLELIRLQTEHDALISDVYVLKSEYEKYVQLLDQSIFDCVYVMDWWGDYCVEHPMSKELYRSITSLEAEKPLSNLEVDGHTVRVCLYEENHIFYRFIGEISRDKNAFYWTPSEYREDWGVFPGYYVIYSTQTFYPVAEEYFSELARYID